MSVVKEANPAAIKIAKKFADAVHGLVPEALVKLFGSAARGDMEELSDIDIYVELPDATASDVVKEKINDIAWEVGFAHDRVILSMVYQKSEIWDSPLRSSPFIKAVIREGIPL
jgi:predicted nucleotidyltransferase